MKSTETLNLLETAMDIAYQEIMFPWTPNLDSYAEQPFLPDLPENLLRIKQIDSKIDGIYVAYDSNGRIKSRFTFTNDIVRILK